MKRRHFLKSGLSGTLAVSLASPAIAKATKTLKVLTAHAAQFAPLAETINSLGDHGLTFDVLEVDYAAEPESLNILSKGKADACFASLDRFANANPALPLFSNMPFGMSSSELESWIDTSDGGDVLAGLFDDTGLVFFFASDSGIRPIWSNAPLDAGLSGKKIGSSGVAMEILSRLDAETVDIGDPNTPLSQLEVIEGATVAQIQQAGLLDQMAMSMSNPFRPSALSTLIIRKPVMDALTLAQQTILSRACSAEIARSRSHAFHLNAVAGREKATFQLPDELWQAGHGAAQQHLETIFTYGAAEAAVVDAYIYFLGDAAGWSRIGEAAYHKGRKRSFSG